MARLMRINMSNRSIEVQDVPEKYSRLAGRGLTSTIVCDEVDPTCHPLGPNNKIVIAPGIVTGTAAPSSGRISVGAKSPLTGGIKESNAGTPFGQTIARLGYKAIIIEGTPSDDKWRALHITHEKVEFIPADDYAGRGLYDLFPSLHQKFGDKVNIMAAGPAVSPTIWGMPCCVHSSLSPRCTGDS